MTLAPDTCRPTVQIELPETWRRAPVSADGDRAGQLALLTAWWQDNGADPAGIPPELVSRLTRDARRGHREGVAFAAVLLERVDEITLAGSLTVGFRRLPGADDPAVAAEGVLRALRADNRPTRRLELVALDADRPAVLARDQGPLLTITEVLWLVPGTQQLAVLAVSAPDRVLAPAYTEVALAAAVSLSVSGGSRMND